MANRYQLHRGVMSGEPYAPYYQGSRGGDSRVIDLVMERGRQQAEAAQRSGDIWGNAINQIGQTIAGGLEEHGRQKAIKKRDAAWLSVLNDPQIMGDPKALYAKSVETFGPEDGVKMFQGVAGAMQLTQQKRDPAADQKALGSVGAAYLKLTPEARALMYPQLRTLTASALPEFGQSMPEQYDPAFDEKVVMPYVKSLQPEAKREKVTTRRPDGTEVTQFVDPNAPGEYESAPLPAKPAEPRVVGRSLVGPDGKVLYRDPLPPQAPREPRLVQVETVGPDGKPMTQFVEPKAGASYAKPTGQGKPATGQQRKALNFFNRAREAEEVAGALEEGEKISTTRLKYTPDWANFAQSDENQKYKQAQRAFTEARLRKESGAAIPEYEYENDEKTYFAQPGDSKETKAQKRKARREVLAGIGFEAGDALKEFYGDEADGLVQSLRSPSKAPQASSGLSSSDDALLKKYGY